MFASLFLLNGCSWGGSATLWNESLSVMSDSFWPCGLYSPWNSPGQNTGVSSLSLLQGIFPTQGLNPGLPHCRWILYQLSHWGSPRILEWVTSCFSSRSSQPRNQTSGPALQADPLPAELPGKLHCGRQLNFFPQGFLKTLSLHCSFPDWITSHESSVIFFL